MKKKVNREFLLVFAAVAVMLTTVRVSAQEPYYVDDAGQISAANGDPKKVQAGEWQVRLYKSGARTGGKDHWGLITGKTAEDVMQQLKSGQDFQVRYAKWAGTDQTSDVSTYFNPLGPIAVLKSTKSISGDKWKKVLDFIERINKARKIFKQIADILGTRPKDSNPYKNVGRVLKEYGTNLKNVEKAMAELLDKINDNSEAMNQINNDLDQIAIDIEKTEIKGTAVQADAISFLPDISPPSPDAELNIEYCCGGYPTEIYYLVQGKREGRSISYGVTSTGGGDNISSTYKEAEGAYRADKKDGPWIESGSSNCVKEGKYVDGEKVGAWIKYCQMKDKVWQTPVVYEGGFGSEDSSKATFVSSFPTHLLEFLQRDGVFVVVGSAR